MFNYITIQHLGIRAVHLIYIMSMLTGFDLLFPKLAEEDNDEDTEATDKTADTTGLKEVIYCQILSGIFRHLVSYLHDGW